MSINVAVQIILSIILTTSSAVLAEMLLCEYEQIKKTCGDLLITSIDDDSREIIYDVIKYLETRPPKYTIWRIFPTDINLIIRMTELSATYVIVLLQFNIRIEE